MKDYKAIIEAARQNRAKILKPIIEDRDRLQAEYEDAKKRSKEAGNEQEFISCRNKADYIRIKLDEAERKIKEISAEPVLSKEDLAELAKEVTRDYQALIEKMRDQFQADYAAMRQHYENSAAAIDGLKADYEELKKYSQDDPGISIGYSPVIGEYIKKGRFIR